MEAQPTQEELVHAPSQPGGATALSRRRWLQAAVGLGAAGFLGGGAYAWLSSRLEVTRGAQAVGLPGGKRLRVAAVSDLHLYGSVRDYSPLVRAIQREEPDLLVVVGDSVDRPTGLPLVSFLSEIEAPIGKFATLGNWEYAALEDIRILRDLYREAGVRLLVNETVALPQLNLVGLDDWVGGQPRPELVVEAAERGATLALAHCPITFDEIVRKLPERGVDNVTVLSGHTHGGQIAPFGLALFTPPGSSRYVTGWYEARGARLYVLRGIGYSYLRMRIGPRPELFLLELC